MGLWSIGGSAGVQLVLYGLIYISGYCLALSWDNGGEVLGGVSLCLSYSRRLAWACLCGGKKSKRTRFCAFQVSTCTTFALSHLLKQVLWLDPKPVWEGKLLPKGYVNTLNHYCK